MALKITVCQLSDVLLHDSLDVSSIHGDPVDGVSEWEDLDDVFSGNASRINGPPDASVVYKRNLCIVPLGVQHHRICNHISYVAFLVLNLLHQVNGFTDSSIKL